MDDAAFFNLEKKLKAQWVSGGAKKFDSPISIEDQKEPLFLEKNELTKVFEESIFFDDEQDVAANRHLCYLPPILHKHNFFEAACVLEGCCTNFINGKTVQLEKGDICIFAPAAVHALCAFDDGTDIRNIMLKKSTFESSFMSLMEHSDILSAFFRRTFFSGLNETPWILFRTGLDEEIRAQIIRIYEESNENRAYKRRMLSALVSGFFISLLRKYEHSVVIPALQNTALEDNFVFMMLYMQEHFASISLEDMSRIFNYSTRQIQRIIKNATGLSFIENIQKLRMEKAAMLLEKTAKSVSQIAEETGYESLNNFRSIFRRTYGFSPAEYRLTKAQRFD